MSSVFQRIFNCARRVFRRPPRWIILTTLVICIEVSYIFIITAGTFTDWPTWNANYDLQAEGFRSGHLYLTVQPPAELLAKKDPFDPANAPLWFWDASLHGGHYYLYWGPLPALVIAGYKAAFHITKPVGDQYPLFFFYTLYLLAGTLLIDRMAKRLFGGIPLWLEILAVLVFAYGNPTPFMIATPGIYEAAIAGGQAFLLLGTLFACDAVDRRGDGSYARRAQVLAGVAFALGLGCRVSIGPPVALIALWTAVSLWRRNSEGAPWRRPLAALLRIMAPVTIMAALLLVYNKLRFEAWLDFGMSSQMSTMQFRTSSQYVLPNLWSYLFRPLAVSCQFPFVSILPGSKGFPSWMQLPPGYWRPEPLAGYLPATPYGWLVPVALVFACQVAWATLRRRRMEPVEAPLAAQQRANLWFLAIALTLAVVTGLPTVAQFIATMRYTADSTTGVALLSIWGGWSLYWHAGERTWQRRVVAGGLVAVAAVTVVLGLLLGTQGYDGMFRNHNPALYEKLVHALSRC
jgi:hypothetical protein